MNFTTLRPEDIKLPSSPQLDSGDQSRDVSPSTPSFLTPRSHPPPRSPSPELTPVASQTVGGQLPFRPRNRSPLSKGQLHSQTSPTMLSPSPMQRAHSSPGVDSSGRFIVPTMSGPRRPVSPLDYSNRRRSPLRSAVEDMYPGASTWSGLNIEPNIPENAELEISTTNLPAQSISDFDLSESSPISSAHNTFPRSRRRAGSPLHQSASVPLFSSLHNSAPSPTSRSASSSPLLTAQRYANEPYPNYSLSSASSMPSTPTSLRSRSPSISSLETIEDSPDAEEAARMEAEELARFRASAGNEEGDNSDGAETRRRSSLELRSVGFASKEKRKRWSVCGAERRADFSLEPIEE